MFIEITIYHEKEGTVGSNLFDTVDIMNMEYKELDKSGAALRISFRSGPGYGIDSRKEGARDVLRPIYTYISNARACGDVGKDGRRKTFSILEREKKMMPVVGEECPEAGKKCL
jgi:hypothetical protein